MFIPSYSSAKKNAVLDSQLGHFGKRWRNRDASKAVFVHTHLEKSEVSLVQDEAQGEDRPDRPVLSLSR